MTNIRAIPIPLILLLPILLAPQLAAADDAISPDPTAISKMTRDTGRSADIDIARLFAQFADAQSTGMWEEADLLAKQIVEYSIESHGFYSKHTSTALTHLASSQAAHGERSAAIQNFVAAIGIIERLESRLSADLIDPLQAMGVAQFRLGDTDRASDAWYRALHISHVNLGPHNIEQVEILQSIAYLYYGAGMIAEARKMRRRIADLFARDSNQGSKEIMSAL
jgi:tetratricopeptide (TPR) repeat protein